MKKHFLLLLMAFMSITAFATDINEVNFSVGSVPYGTDFTTAVEATNTATAGYFTSKEHFLVTYDIPLEKGTHYTWDEKFYSDEACSTEVTLKTSNVGTYYVKIAGKGAFEGTKVSSFKIEKRNISQPLVSGLTKVYGAADPALTADNINWIGADFKNGDTKAVFSGTLTYTYDNGNVGAHTLNVTGFTADNYTLTITGAGLTITAKPITAAMITAAELSKTYKGAAYTADDVAVTVKDGTTPLVAGTDYEIGLYSDAALTTPATPTNVGTYYLGVKDKAGANYSVAATLAAGTLEITKAGLTIRALPQTKVYNATATLPSSAVGTAFEVLGAFAGDDIDNDANVATFNNITLTGNSSPNAGEYTITPGITVANQNGNYDYNFVTAKFTITKRALEIKANDAKKVYGKAETAVTKMDGGDADAIGYGGVTLTPTLEKDADGADIPWAVPADEENEMKAASVAGPPAVVNGDLKVVRLGKGTDENKGDYTGALTLSYTETAPVFANYEVTAVAGTFHITGGKIYVTALNQSKNYGEADPDWTAVKDVNFIVSGLSGDDALVTLPTLTRNTLDGDPVGEYTITPSAAVAPAGYEEIVYATATFSIKARPLTIVAKAQTLKVGDAVADLDQNAYTIANTETNEGLLATDDASDVFTLGFKTGIASPLAAGGTYADGIVKVDGAKAANYAIAFVPGKLIVIDPNATIVLNRPAKAAYTATPELDNAAATITAAAADKYTAAEAIGYNAGLTGAVSSGDGVPTDFATKVGHAAAGATLTGDEAAEYNATLDGAVSTEDVQKKFVTFSDFNMIAEKWYPIVLPFATSVKEVSETFGYAIVNILKKDNTDKTKIAFKLHMGEIPANEPFVVKVYEDVNMNEVTFGDITEPTTAKTIVKSAAPEVADASGVKFIGSYSAKTDGFKANEAFFSVSASKNDYYWGSATNTTYMAPLAAYFQIPEGAAARIIEFEEADGTTTAINFATFSNDVEKMNAEGWYTIGGQKLNGAPTQKGIFINNGKKVIIK